jgi:signal transduction histidine kinase
MACWAIRLAVLVLATWLAGCGGDRDAQVLHATEAEFRMEPGGQWEPPQSVPGQIAGDAGWSPVTLPHARARSVAESASSASAPPQVAWYRVHLPASEPSREHDLVLYLPRWQTIGVVAVYVDGHLVHRTHGSRVWNSFNRPLLLRLDGPADPGAGHAVHVRMASQQGVGGALSTMRIGPKDSLQWRYRVRSFLQNELISHSSSAFFIIGLFSLAVWCVRRRESMYFWFFAASAAHLARMLHYVVADGPPMLPDDWFGWMTVNALGWVVVCIFAFGFRLHRKRMPLVAGVVIGAVLACSVATLPVPRWLPHMATMLPLAYLVVGVLLAVIAVSGLWASYTARSREALVLFAWFSLMLPVGIHDLLLQTYRIDMERVYLAPYTSISLFIIFLVIVYRRYVGAIAGVEAANATLETKLAERERALTASHEQLRELERQQTLTAERQRMMQDMHDGIGSSLMSALRMVERGHASPADTAQVLKDCIDDLKLAIDSLETHDADLLALLAALRFRLAPRLKAAGIDLTWSVRDLPPLAWLDPQNALHVLRILQEVLTNILKHSGARDIDVATFDEDDMVLVRIRDTGRAFVPGEPGAAGGRGLASIRTRAQALQARCDWSTWERGAEFRLRLPVSRPAPA